MKRLVILLFWLEEQMSRCGFSLAQVISEVQVFCGVQLGGVRGAACLSWEGAHESRVEQLEFPSPLPRIAMPRPAWQHSSLPLLLSLRRAPPNSISKSGGKKSSLN